MEDILVLGEAPVLPKKKGDTNRAEDDADDDGKKQRAPPPHCAVKPAWEE